MLVDEEDQYTVLFRKYQADFLPVALKQTKGGPWSSETPVLVICNYRPGRRPAAY